MTPMAIYVPTRGRMGMQSTLNSLPKEWLARTTVVCPPEDAVTIGRSYPKLHKIQTPPTSKMPTLTAKRHWIFQTTPFKKILQLDDDLRFHFRKSPDDTALRQATAEDVAHILKRIERALQIYAHATITSRFMSHVNKCEFKYNGRVCHALGHDVETVLKHVDTKRATLCQDADYTLQLFHAGYESAVYCWGTQEEVKGWNADGGVSLYRTAKLFAQVARDLERWHPGIVKAKIPDCPTDAFQWGVSLRFNWKKAISEGLELRGVLRGTIKGDQRR
jgi:hypothetical protein